MMMFTSKFVINNFCVCVCVGLHNSDVILFFYVLKINQVYQWINELSNPETRENALLLLSKKRESVPDLAPMLWHSFGTIAALLQEIINIYPSINPTTLTAHQSNRVCNALALLQCVASHPETRSVFLQAHIPLFLYPFLHTTSKTRPFEYLRLTSLGVIGALVKVKMTLNGICEEHSQISLIFPD